MPIRSCLAERVHVAVEVPRGRGAFEEVRQRVDADVGPILAVTEAPGRRMGQEHVDTACPAYVAGELPQAPSVFALGVLVRPVLVAHAPTQAGDPNPCGHDDAPVGVDHAAWPRAVARPAVGVETKAGARGLDAGGGGIVVAGHEDHRGVGRRRR